MKKWVVFGLLALVAVAATAQTCIVRNVRITEIDGKPVVAGEMVNESGANLLEHNYLVAFLGSSNNLLETKVVPGCPRSLQNNTSSFFAATGSSDPDDVKNSLWRLNFDSTLKAGTVQDSDITISDVSVLRNGETLTVTGTIKNNDNYQLEDIEVCIVVRDSSNRIVTIGKDTTLSDLGEDDTDTFSITIDELPDSSSVIDEVDVYVDGRDDDDLVRPASIKGRNVIVGTATPTVTQTPAGTSTPTATPTPE